MGIGPNRKAQEGRERKAAQKEIKKKEEQKKKEEIEAKEWEKGAKIKSKKQIQEEEKRAEKAQRKLEKDRLEASEAAEMAALKPHKAPPKEKPKLLQKSTPIPARPTPSHTPEPAQPQPEGDVYSASNIDDALLLLEAAGSSSSLNKLERHPERRVRAAYAAYEERELPLMKAEYPGLRLAQLREKIRKQWQKAPENPFNQSHIAYNATKSQEILQTTGELEVSLERLRFSPPIE